MAWTESVGFVNEVKCSNIEHNAGEEIHQSSYHGEQLVFDCNMRT